MTPTCLKMRMWKHIQRTLQGASGLCFILIMAVSILSPAAALLPPTLETKLSANNVIFDKVLPTPSISIELLRSATLEANFTTQFESNSSDASIDWEFLSQPICSLVLHRARFEIFGYLTTWKSPVNKHYFEPGAAYLFGNETGTLSFPSGQQLMTYHFAFGGPIREMQTAYSSDYPKNLTIDKNSVPVIIGGFVALSTNCGVQNFGYTYFADLKVTNQLQTEPEIQLSVPADATISFFSSNLVRLRPTIFWLPLSVPVQRFYVQYDLTPLYLQYPYKDIIVGLITFLAVSIPTWAFRVVKARRRKQRERERKEELEWYLH